MSIVFETLCVCITPTSTFVPKCSFCSNTPLHYSLADCAPTPPILDLVPGLSWTAAPLVLSLFQSNLELYYCSTILCFGARLIFHCVAPLLCNKRSKDKQTEKKTKCRWPLITTLALSTSAPCYRCAFTTPTTV